MYELLLYNIILSIIYKEDKEKEFLYQFIPYVITVLGLFYIEIGKPIEFFSIYFLICINYGIIFVRDKENMIKRIFFFVSLDLIGIIFIFKCLSIFTINIKIICSFIYILLINIILILNVKKEYNLVFKISIFCNVILVFSSILIIENFRKIPISFILLDNLLLCIFNYSKVSKDIKDILNYFIPLLSIFIGTSIIYKFNFNEHFYLMYSIIVWIISEIFMILETKNRFPYFIISNAYLLSTYLGCAYFLYGNIFYLLLINIIFIYCTIKYKYVIFKYLGYFGVIILIYNIKIYFDLSYELLLIPYMIFSIISIIIEKIVKKLHDDFSLIFQGLLISLIYFMIYNVNSFIYLIFGGIYTFFVIIVNRKSLNTSLEYFDLIPLIGFLTNIILLEDVDEIFKIIFLGIAGLLLMIYSYPRKKISLHMIFSGVYILALYNYLNTMFFFCIWSIINTMILAEETEKSLFKIISTISLLVLYNQIIQLLYLDQYTIFKYAGYIIADIFLIKDVIRKYIDDSEIIEAISLGIIYLISLINYTDEIDGMLFVLLIIGIVIFSYFKNYGMTFIISILTIIINAILLTREFWLSIPWWIYLLGIGGFLIVFAGTNEARQNKKTNNNVLNKIKTLKERIDKK